MTATVSRTQANRFPEGIEFVDVLPPFNRYIPSDRTYPDVKVKQEVRELALHEAEISGSKVIKPLHILLALFPILNKSLVGEIVLRSLFGQDPDGVESMLRVEQSLINRNPFKKNIQLSQEVQRIFKKTRNNGGYIGLLLNLLKCRDPNIQEIKNTFGITDAKINEEYRMYYNVPKVIRM